MMESQGRNLEFDRNKLFKKLCKNLADWVRADLTDPVLYRTAYQNLTKELESKVSKTCMDASFSAGYASVHEANRGASAVLKGNSEGWKLLALSLRLHYAAMQLYVCACKKEGDFVPLRTCSFNTFSLNFCFAIAWNEEEIATWYASQIRILYDAELENEVSFDYPFRGLIREMAYCYPNRARPGSMTTDQVGVYGEIFSAWEDTEALSAAVFEACDYHLLRSLKFKGQPSDPAFLSTSYAVFPVEILALLEYRRKYSGFEFPVVDHPLLKSDLAVLPDRIQPDHAILAALAEKKNRCC